MEKILLFQNDFINEENAAFHLEYFLLIRSAEMGETYGGMIRKTAADADEEDSVDSLCENREEMETFLSRLAEGCALPMELAVLCDDYISDRENEKNAEAEITAS